MSLQNKAGFCLKETGKPVDFAGLSLPLASATIFSGLATETPHVRWISRYVCDRWERGNLLRRAVLLPTVNFPYRRLGDRVLSDAVVPDAVVPGPTALKVEIDLHGILAEGGRRAGQAQRQSGN